MKYELIGFYAAVVLVAASMFGSWAVLEGKRLQSLQASLESATARGINPIAVRCAYAKSDDTICVVYASKSVSTIKE